ncbi:MAG: hypothetical protein NT125_09165 [Candidatus Bipolaricaulota bacterium]|nr:hypothetical protein [Candidatus Bipolaricaulota bacterium]
MSVTYPESFGNAELASKQVTYVVTPREAKRRQLPELTDEFVPRVSDRKTVAELREHVRGVLELVKQGIAEQDRRNELVRRVVRDTTVEVPQALIEQEFTARKDRFEIELRARGLGLEEYLRRNNLRAEEWEQNLRLEARSAVERALVLDEIGGKENLKVTEEEIEGELARQAEEAEDHGHQQRRRADLTEAEFRRLVDRLFHRKVISYLIEKAEIVSAQPTERPEVAEEPLPAEAKPSAEAESGG